MRRKIRRGEIPSVLLTERGLLGSGLQAGDRIEGSH